MVRICGHQLGSCNYAFVGWAIVSANRGNSWVELSKHLLLWIIVVLTFYPFAFMFITSLKTQSQFEVYFWQVVRPFHWENYAFAWAKVAPYIANSIIICVAATTLILVVSSMSAYVFARFAFPFKEALFYAILGIVMIPGTLTLITRFVLVKRLGLLDTRWVLILPYVAGGQVFSILFLRTFFASIPEELFEAARLDGASELASCLRIAIPLSMPILSTVAILNILAQWNDLIWPLITITSEHLKTIPVGIAYFRTSIWRPETGQVMAAYMITSLPLVVLFFASMRTFIEGLTSGAIKA